jgi:hypothetical protein
VIYVPGKECVWKRGGLVGASDQRMYAFESSAERSRVRKGYQPFCYGVIVEAAKGMVSRSEESGDKVEDKWRRRGM